MTKYGPNGTNFDWHKLRAFYMVARTENISFAAKKLGLSQPALSRQISILENSLNVQLFYRHSRGLKLTRQGEIIYEATKEIFEKITNIQSLLTLDMEAAKGPLKIGTTITLSSAWLPKFIAEFSLTYPEINISIVGRNEAFDFSCGEADVALTPSLPDDKRLISHHLTNFHSKMYASKEYINEFGAPQTVEELIHHRLLDLEDEPSMTHLSYNFHWMLQVGMPKGKKRKPFISLNNTLGLIELAKQGVGIINLAEEMYTANPANLVPVLPHISGPETPLYFIYNDTLKDSQRIKVFLDFLKERV